jgi:shikimate dehydrogenase
MMAKKYKFALLGTPIEHSLSPEIHKIFAEGCGLDIDYIKIDTDKPQLKDTVERLKSEGFLGFNCTMPLKEEIFKYADKKSLQSELLKVCNTVKINENGVLSGYTTDGDGMAAGIKYNGVEVTGKNILVFGAGGTTKSVILSLIMNQAKNIVVLNRSKPNLDIIQDLFKKYENIVFDLLNLNNIEKYIKDYDIDILINTSQLGMKGFEESPEFDSEYNFLGLLKQDAAVVDSVYNPLNTKLLNAAQGRGFKIIDGFWMLVYQGVSAFEIWTCEEVPEEYIEKAHGIIKR